VSKRKLGDNPLATLTGQVGKGGPSPYDRHYPPVSYRLPPEIAAEIKAIAEAEGVQVGQVAAYALAYFCDLYKRGEVALPTRDVTQVRKVVDITRKQ